MLEIVVNNLYKSFGTFNLFEGLNLQIQKDTRTGLIGRNGTGKTTLFRILARKDDYKRGDIFIKSDKSISYLEQNPNYQSSKNVEAILNLAFKENKRIKRRMDEITEKLEAKPYIRTNKLMRKYNHLQNKFEIHGGYDTDVKLNKVCSGLKISKTMREMKFISLSGGEKTRVLLAKMLLENPDILLLDEPTNHLDIGSVEWLESYLKRYKGTVLVISHDRYFLDRMVTNIIEIENKKAHNYSGNYSDYKKEKAKKIELQFKAYKDQQKKIKAMEEAIKRYRDWGERGDNPSMFKKAFNIEKRLEKMEKINKPQEKRNINLNFKTKHRSGEEVVKLKNISKSFEDNIILRNLNFNLYYQERISIIGKNGSGKSTIFKLLMNEIEPDKGQIKIGSRVKIGYLEQEVSFEKENITLLDYFRKAFPVSETEARNKLAGFLFFGEEVYKKINILSGGEKVRFKLCLLMNRNINLLLLDEPTNHLDLDAIEMFEKALNNFEGTILIISHDRYFINTITEKIAAIENNKLKIYLGSYEDYRKKQLDKTQEKNDSKISQKKQNKIENYKHRKKTANKKKKWKRRISEIQKIIKNNENMLEEIEYDIQKFRRDYEKLEELHNKKSNIQADIENLFLEWQELESKLSD